MVNKPPNQKFRLSTFVLIYDPPHLFKNVINKWLTEKTQSLDFHDPVSHNNVKAKWSDLVSIYKEESMTCVKRTMYRFWKLKVSTPFYAVWLIVFQKGMIRDFQIKLSWIQFRKRASKVQ